MLDYISASGAKVPTANFTPFLDPASIGVTEEIVAGPQLRMLLSNALMFLGHYEEQRAWILQAQNLYAAYTRKDHVAAGFAETQWYLYAQAMAPVWRIEPTQSTNMINMFRKLKGRLEDAEISLTAFFSNMSRTVAEDLLPLLTGKDGDTRAELLDSRGILLIYLLFERQDVSTRRDVAALRENAGIRKWIPFSERLDKLEKDPIQVALDLGLTKLHHVVQFLESSQISDEELRGKDGKPGFFDQMVELPTESVIEFCRSPHARASDYSLANDDSLLFDAEDEEDGADDTTVIDASTGAVVSDKKAKKAVHTPGASDESTPLVIQVKSVNDGYIKGEVIIPAHLAAHLQRVVGAQFVQDGKQKRMSGAALVDVK